MVMKATDVISVSTNSSGLSQFIWTTVFAPNASSP
jgi:hypothetical protein